MSQSFGEEALSDGGYYGYPSREAHDEAQKHADQIGRMILKASGADTGDYVQVRSHSRGMPAAPETGLLVVVWPQDEEQALFLKVGGKKIKFRKLDGIEVLKVRGTFYKSEVS